MAEIQGRKQPALVVRDLLLVEGDDRNRWAWRYGQRATADDPVDYIDLTSWHARAQIRPRYGATPWWVATHEDAITLTADGHIYMEIPSSETDRAPWWGAVRQSGALWDLELVDPSSTAPVVRFAEGAVLYAPNVTRPDGKDAP